MTVRHLPGRLTTTTESFISLAQRQPTTTATMSARPPIVSPPALPAPSALAVYTCPSRPCPVLCTTMEDSITHLRTHHPIYERVHDSFGTIGLERIIPRAILHPTTAALHPGNGAIHPVAIVCLLCNLALPTVSAAEAHLLATRVHDDQVAAKRAVSGKHGLHTLLQRMRIVPVAEGAAAAAAPVLDRMNHDANPNPNQDQNQHQNPDPAPPAATIPKGKLTLRALLGETRGAVITLPRTTRLAALPGLLLHKLPGVDWHARVAAGMKLRYASVKMGGGTARMDVRDEADWKRVVRDAKRGGSVEWAGEEEVGEEA